MTAAFLRQAQTVSNGEIDQRIVGKAYMARQHFDRLPPAAQAFAASITGHDGTGMGAPSVFSRSGSSITSSGENSIQIGLGRPHIAPIILAMGHIAPVCDEAAHRGH